MSLSPLNLPPGVYRAGTEYSSKNRWYDCNLVRFHDGTIRPIGGWRTKSTTTLIGSGRAIITWKANPPALTKYAGIGTHKRLYVMGSTGTLTNITPYRETGTLGNDPFAVVNTLTTVTVTDTAHGLTVGDYVNFSGASAGGGITINGEYLVVTTPTADSYTITHSAPATSTDATTGGAAVAYSYELSFGLSDSTTLGGYGTLDYGEGSYGAPRLNVDITTEARVWSLDTWGQYLVAAPGDGGNIYEWQLSLSTRAAKIANSPVADAIHVTEENFLFALYGKNVAWSDQGNNTLWTPAATNQAGDKDLQTVGRLLCGKHANGASILFTDVDVHRATYIGGQFIYSFEKIGEGCGAISKTAVGDTDVVLAWMGRNSFWQYDGYIRPLPCDVADYVFSNLNVLQRAKVSCRHDAGFGEITWHYPSANSLENDRYVTWHIRESYNTGRSIWTFGNLARLAGTDRGAFTYPLLIGSDGYVYEHEAGWNYDGAVPFLESGPSELGQGDQTMDIRDYIPDEKTAGDVTLTIKTKMYPNGPESTTGPFTAANPRNLRITGRQAKARYDGVTTSDWRVGAPRFDVQPGSMR